MTDLGPSQNASTKPIINVRGLHKYFGPLHVIQGVDLEVEVASQHWKDQQPNDQDYDCCEMVSSFHLFHLY